MKKTEAIQLSKDTPAILLIIFDGFLMLAATLSVLLRLRPNDFRVPVQYIVYDGTVVQSGNWYSLYAIVLFILISGGITFYLARRLHEANRYFAIATLSAYAVVGIFALFSINALLTLVQKV